MIAAAWGLKMLPSIAAPNFGDGSFPEPELLGNHAQWACYGANFTNLVCGKFGSAIGLSAFLFARAALGVSVDYVVGICSKEKMLFVAARRIVAPVTDLHPNRDGAVFFFPRQTVCTAPFTLPPKLPVSVVVPSPQPRPAGIRATALVGVVVKTLRKRPVTQTRGSFSGISSHLTALLRRSVVRVETVLNARFRPAFSTIGARSC